MKPVIIPVFKSRHKNDKFYVHLTIFESQVAVISGLFYFIPANIYGIKPERILFFMLGI